MYYVFYKTNDVFIAEDRLEKNQVKCKIVPTPVQDKAYCGICLRVNEKEILVDEILKDMEFKIIT